MLHTQVERSDFMRALLRGRMKRHAYCAMLRNLHAIYAALEPALEHHAADRMLAPLFLPALWREAALVRDLETLHGPGWRTAFALQPAATRYAGRLRSLDEAQPALLAAHSYVRYLGDLSGGQMLERIVRVSLSPPPGAGTDFYAFGDPAATARLRQAYRDGLEALAPDADGAAAIVAEARLAFEMHQQLFDELAAAELSR